MRSNFDGSDHETLFQTGGWGNKKDAADQLNRCVGIFVNKKEGKFYWTQKSLSKAGKGRIFRANIEAPINQPQTALILGYYYPDFQSSLIGDRQRHSDSILDRPETV